MKLLLPIALFWLVTCGPTVVTSRLVIPQASSKIVGGQPVQPGEIPYQVLLNGYAQDKPYCGGSLVEVNNFPIVISAAHCFEKLPDPTDWQVVAGTVDYRNMTNESQERNLTRIIVHEDYNAETLENDIALLFLDEPFNITPYVDTIKLPETLEDEKNVDVSGWGFINGTGDGIPSDVLRVARLPVMQLEKCREIWAKHPSQSEVVTETMICVGGGGEKSACHGDSGGPAVNKWGTLVGITSHGEEHCNPEYPSFFTRVSHFIDWIKGNVDCFKPTK